MVDIRDVFGAETDEVLAKNREVALLAEGFAAGPVRKEVADRIIALGIQMKGHILPRGTIEEPAEDRFPKKGSLGSLLARLDETVDADELRDIVRIAGEWGDGSAVDRVAGLLGHADRDVRHSCILALAMIGGPAAASALQAHAEKEGDEGRLAAHYLSELRCGGTIDLHFGDTVGGLPSEEQARHWARGGRISLESPGTAGDKS